MESVYTIDPPESKGIALEAINGNGGNDIRILCIARMIGPKRSERSCSRIGCWSRTRPKGDEVIQITVGGVIRVVGLGNVEGDRFSWYHQEQSPPERRPWNCRRPGCYPKSKEKDERKTMMLRCYR